MIDSVIKPKSFTPKVEVISAREILYLLTPTNTSRHVSFLFPDTQQLISYRVRKGYGREFWTCWPAREDDAVETLKKDGMDSGLSADSNALYVVDYDLPAFRKEGEPGQVDSHGRFRFDLSDVHTDSGDDCLAAFYSPEHRELYLHRIRDGGLQWLWGSNMMTYTASIEALALERKETGLSVKAAPLYILDRESLDRASQFKAQKNSLTRQNIERISVGNV